MGMLRGWLVVGSVGHARVDTRLRSRLLETPGACLVYHNILRES